MSANVATTQWSQVLAARDGSDTEARAALEMLCQTYWQPLYAYIRHQGSDPEEARDLTQAYFTELLDKDFLADVDPSKGRFRSFLLATLRNFLSHQRDRDRALKRGGGTPTLSLDVAAGEESYASQQSNEMTPEEVFEHRWALAVLDRAMGRLQEESAESGDLIQFDKLKPYLTSAEPQATYQETAGDLGMSVGAVKTAVHRMRKRYGLCLRAEIAQTVANPAETDEEVRHLLATVRP
jgi:RNA polymerase sigma-70 factor (ECF subfamily)